MGVLTVSDNTQGVPAAKEASAAATKAEQEFAATGVLPDGYVYDPSALRRDEPTVRKMTAEEKETAFYDIRGPLPKMKKG